MSMINLLVKWRDRFLNGPFGERTLHQQLWFVWGRVPTLERGLSLFYFCKVNVVLAGLGLMPAM
jgi:hypothetical protein